MLFMIKELIFIFPILRDSLWHLGWNLNAFTFFQYTDSIMKINNAILNSKEILANLNINIVHSSNDFWQNALTKNQQLNYTKFIKTQQACTECIISLVRNWYGWFNIYDLLRYYIQTMENSFDLFADEVINITFPARKHNTNFWDSLSAVEQHRYNKFFLSHWKNIQLIADSITKLPNVEIPIEVLVEIPSNPLKYALIPLGMLILGTCLCYPLALFTA